ncbi:hypothetical protein ACHAWF_018423 [Thalassiosira exigua]
MVHRDRRLLAAAAALAFAAGAARAQAQTPSIDEAILVDLLTRYDGYDLAPSSCADDATTIASTTTSFAYPGTPEPGSKWDPTAATFESSLFQALMSHANVTDPRNDWTIRIGTGGNMYSHYAPRRHGEAMPPQVHPAGEWVDEVDQIVAVNGALNSNPSHPETCADPADSETCAPYFVHQAGAYREDAPYTTDVPVYSPSLAKHCEGNGCYFASWGTQAHLPTPYTSPVIYVTKFTNCGDGIVEHTMMMHNFADPHDASVPDSKVDLTYFNVAWSAVRPSNLPYALEPDAGGTLDYADVNDVPYLPLCRWGTDDAAQAGRARPRPMSQTDGYTSFVGEGLIVNRTAAPLELWCSKPGGCTAANQATCMEKSCTDAQVADSGYKRIELGVKADTAPGCSFHNTATPYAPYVGLKCNFRLEAGFAYTSDPDPCAPWKDSRIGFKNAETGAVLEVSYVRHWSWTADQRSVFFSVFEEDDGTSGTRNAAASRVNAMFAGGENNVLIELTTIYMSSVKPWCSVPGGCVGEGADAATCMTSCTEEEEASGGYARIQLGVPAVGPGCQADDAPNPHGGLVALKCNFRSSTGFGQANANVDSKIAFYNPATGKSVQVAFVKHWSWDVDDYLVYFSLDIVDDGVNAMEDAIANVNDLFANSGPGILPIELRSLTETSADAIPQSYDPAALPAFTFVYGKGEEYNGNVAGTGRRRIGMASDQRDFAVFTNNWWNGASLGPGKTYLNRRFMFVSDLGSVEGIANDLATKTHITEIGENEFDPRSIDLYRNADGTIFAAVAASSSSTQTSCAGTGMTLACTGFSTPSPDFRAFFYSSCGATSYVGPDPYTLTPSFGAVFPDHGALVEKETYCIKVTTGPSPAAAGDLQVLVNSGSGFISTGSGNFGSTVVVLDECYDDFYGVQIKAISTNGWIGSVLLSRDAKQSYSPLTCENCSGSDDISSQNVVVAGYVQEVCILVTTDDHKFAGGPVSINVNNGNGYIEAASGTYSVSQLVLDDCFDNLQGVQVQNTNGNGWIGSIRYSTDNKATYRELPCADCIQDASAGTIYNKPGTIVADGDGNGIGYAPTACLNGQACTLPYTYEPVSVCVLVQTGTGNYYDGPVEVFVNSNTGEGFVRATISPTKIYNLGEVVVDQCFANVEAIQVRAPTNNGWIGSVRISMDNKASYQKLPCIDCTGADPTNADLVVVDGTLDGAGLVGAECLGGAKCTFAFNRCVKVQTGDGLHNDGSLKVWVDAGNGYVLEASSSGWGIIQVVLDKCYGEIVGVKIQGHTNNAWAGSVLLSTDNKASYHPMTCPDCTGATTTESIAVDSNSDGGYMGAAQCVNGQTCELTVQQAQTGSMVRSYACKDEDPSARASWKLLGWFDNTCTGLETATYDETACSA